MWIDTLGEMTLDEEEVTQGPSQETEDLPPIMEVSIEVDSRMKSSAEVSVENEMKTEHPRLVNINLRLKKD